tara:strand:- start:217 stop:699 length:483 start_codon:yes stop_codon:yes gene_type:complete
MKIIGIVGWKNTGKTFFVSKIIKKLKSKNYRIASIKHAHHTFDIDHPNTDSYIHRISGSSQVIISSSKRWAKINEIENQNEKKLDELISEISETDIVIVEGYKNENHPKIEIINDKKNKFLFQNIKNVRAIISNFNFDIDIKQFKQNEIDEIVNFILNEM